MLRPKMNSAQLTQLVLEETRGVYNPAGERRVMAGFKIIVQPAGEHDNFRPGGANDDAYHAKTKAWRALSGTFRLNFEDWKFLAPLAYGPAVDSSAGGGTTTDIYEMPPMGERGAPTATVEYGERGDCERCPFGFVVDISNITFDRDGQSVEGQITMLCQEPEAENIGVPMTGWEAANQTWDLTSTDGAHDGVITIKDAGGNTLGTYTDHPGDSNATVKGAVEAVTGIDTAIVTGSVPAPVPTNFATDDTKISATSTGSTNVPANAIDGNSGSNWTPNTNPTTGAPQRLIYDMTTPRQVLSFNLDTGNGSTVTFDATLKAADDAAFTVNAVTVRTFNDELVPVNSTNYVLTTPPTKRFWCLEFTDVQGGAGATVPVVQEFQLLGAPTGGGGTRHVEISAPEHTRFIFETSSTGWSELETQRGAAGGDVKIPQNKPMLVQQVTHYRASSYEGLDTAPPIDRAKGATMSLTALAEAHWYTAENVLTFGDMVDSAEPRKEFSITVGAESTHVPPLLLLAEKQPSQPQAFEHRIKHSDSVRQVRIQHYSAVRDVAEQGAAGNAKTFVFPLGPVLPETGSAHRLLISYPTPA